jgi:hypothetical protein
MIVPQFEGSCNEAFLAMLAHCCARQQLLQRVGLILVNAKLWTALAS